MPIPTESIDVDMTADHDQEHLWAPLTNLGPSEQLRLLRARIAKLESQQTTPASSCTSFELVAQNENDAVDTLCSQTDEIVPNNGKEAMADQQEEEEQTKADQTEHLLEKITQIELEVMNMKQWKAELLAKIEELEFKQKADQQKEDCAKIDEVENFEFSEK
uniref:Ovule protein n=1 Tax=Globodera pallida TaxID=36090 RepID=A0A183BIP5_GLOPA